MPDLHDMGGQTEYFGPIVRQPNEPVFHEPWERRVFGMVSFVHILTGRNLDAFRFEIEQLPRELYLSGYYARFLAALERRLVKAGYVGAREVDARVEGERAEPGLRRAPRARVALTARIVRLARPTWPSWVCVWVLPRVFGTARPTLRRPRFHVGDRILVRRERAEGHTRQPRYVTGRLGHITAHHGATVFPDAHAVGRRERPQHLYTVAFEGSDLWGAAAEEGTEVRVDLFESYLEPA